MKAYGSLHKKAAIIGSSSVIRGLTAETRQTHGRATKPTHGRTCTRTHSRQAIEEHPSPKPQEYHHFGELGLCLYCIFVQAAPMNPNPHLLLFFTNGIYIIRLCIFQSPGVVPPYSRECTRFSLISMLDAHQAVPTGALRPTESCTRPQDPNG